jgi:ABC-type transport system involved in multi-copper enzyme maturation permease subunit
VTTVTKEEEGLDDDAEAVVSSRWRSWCFLVWLSWRRQARVRQMVWIALGLLIITTCVVAMITATGHWLPRWAVRNYVAREAGWAGSPAPMHPLAAALGLVVLHDAAEAVGPSHWQVWAFASFSRSVIFEVLFSFLLPVWTLSFATQALGNEREERSLVWLLSRPLPRSAVYLAKFVAALPWSLAFNLGGFGLVCLAGGEPGRLAFRLFWPAVVLGTLAYAALFCLVGAYFRRPAVVAIVYTFFLETFVGQMPGHMKRASISFFTRCLMLDEAGESRLPSWYRPAIFIPVDGTTAWTVLLLITVALLAAGMVLFARLEYHEAGG